MGPPSGSGAAVDASDVDSCSTPLTEDVLGDESIITTTNSGHQYGESSRREITRAGVPAEIADLDRWLLWRYEIRDGRWTKVPYDAKQPERRAAVNRPETFASLDVALEAYRDGHGDGIGIVLGAGLSGVDWDGIIDPATGEVDPCAAQRALRLNTYVEVSPSGRGLHALVIGEKPEGRCRDGNIEIYGEGRYFTFTGERFGDSPTTVNERTAELAALHAEVFPAKPAEPAATREPAGQVHLLDDDELLRKAHAAKNGDRFAALWAGNWDGLYSSQNEADLALVSMLAFYAGPDPERIDRLFRQSGLYRRKWDAPRRGSTYGANTIATALEGKHEFYRGRRDAAAPHDSVPPPGAEDDPRANAHHWTKYVLTDSGNGERFANAARDKHIFCTSNHWKHWDGKRWGYDACSHYALRTARDVARKMLEQAAVVIEDKRRQQIVNHWHKSESQRGQNAMIALAARESGMSAPPDAFDRDPMLLNVANGTIDLRTGELRGHDPGDRITKLVPVPYYETAEAPRFAQFRGEVFGDQELEAYIQRLIGYCLTARTVVHLLVIFWGEGSNGKSTFVELLRRLLGDYAIALAPDVILTSRHGDDNLKAANKAQLLGCRLALMQETAKQRRFDEALVKALTGGDEITACRKYENPITFSPTHKLILSTNHRPRIANTDHGIWRRIHLVPFTRRFEGKAVDDELPEKLLAELPGVLAWAVQGCLEWQRHGLNPPSVVQAAVQQYRHDEDIVGRFLDECCVVNPTAWAPVSELCAALEAWAKDEGVHGVRIEDVRERLRALGCIPGDVRKRGGRAVRGWGGVGIRSADAEETQP